MIRLPFSIEPLVRLLPASWAAAIDYHLRPHLRREWHGPFNGQHHRQQIFRDLVAACDFVAIAETGTYRGSTTEFMARQTGLPVYTAEVARRYHGYAARRLRRVAGVHLFLDDSRRFLRRLAEDPEIPKSSVFFYLDAHWYGDHPLLEELGIIFSRWSRPVVMIDDFAVPDDPGYDCDDEGAGRRLCLAYIEPPLLKFDLVPFFPRLRSELESGSRQGCVVLARGETLSLLGGVTSLRRCGGRREASSV
ncbi:MAG: hypothetical protein AB1714_16590 [Acidobacteriota bacterium]